MRLANLKEFRRLIYSPESAPAISTLRARIEQIPGGTKEGTRYYVDLDEFDRVTNLRTNLVAQQQSLSKRPELDGLI